MHLDYQTLFITFIYTDIVLLGILFYYILFIRPKKWQISTYLIYKILETMALIGLGMRTSQSSLVLSQLTNTFLSLSIFFHVFSIISYEGIYQKKITYILGSITLISIITFYIIADSKQNIALTSSLFMMISYCIAGVYLLTHRKTYKLPFVIAIGFLVFAMINAGRGISLIDLEEGYRFYQLDSFWDILLIFSALTIIIMSAIGFLLLLKEIDDKIIFKQHHITSIAFNESPVSVVMTDHKGYIQFVNPKFRELTGFTVEEVVGKRPNVLQSGLTPPETYKKLWRTIKSGRTWKGEFFNKKKNGDKYCEEAVIAPIKDDMGSITNFLAIKTDITQRKENEIMIELRNKELSESNHTKDRLFSIIAHDLKGPLANLEKLLELANHDISLGDLKGGLNILDMMKKSARATHDLLVNLLTWSRSQLNVIKVNIETFDLSLIVAEVIQLFHSVLLHKNISVAYKNDKSHFVKADEDMIATVLRNLLSNAIKFTPAGGNISIDMMIKDESVMLTIQDSGVGIETSRQKKIFDIAENQSTPGTAGEKGTGLGLVLAREFVEKNHGRIWVESSEGKGSIFSISLPWVSPHS